MLKATKSQTYEQTYHLPTFNLTEGDCCEKGNNYENKTIETPLQFYSLSLDRENLNVASHKLKILRNEIDEASKSSSSNFSSILRIIVRGIIIQQEVL